MSRRILAVVVLSLFSAIGAIAEEPMNHAVLQTTIGEGPNQSVDKLWENAFTKLVQITLRNGAVLAKHTAKEPITIQCVSGEGTLVLGETRIALKPGIVVPLEPNVEHAVESSPAVSVLVTRFLPAAGAAKDEHAHHH
jgi:quercetin dioxygenase-like cupin family protein